MNSIYLDHVVHDPDNYTIQATPEYPFEVFAAATDTPLWYFRSLVDAQRAVDHMYRYGDVSYGIAENIFS